MILGIDVGSTSGAYGVLDVNGQFVTCDFLPTSPFSGSGKLQVNPSLFAKLVKEIHPDLAVVEWAQAMPKQGVSGVFTYATAFGIILGVLGGLGVPWLLVRPASWKKAMQLSRNKGHAITLALQRFPDAAPFLSLKKHHNLAEALLLADYQRRRNLIA